MFTRKPWLFPQEVCSFAGGKLDLTNPNSDCLSSTTIVNHHGIIGEFQGKLWRLTIIFHPQLKVTGNHNSFTISCSVRWQQTMIFYHQLKGLSTWNLTWWPFASPKSYFPFLGGFHDTVVTVVFQGRSHPRRFSSSPFRHESPRLHVTSHQSSVNSTKSTIVVVNITIIKKNVLVIIVIITINHNHKNH